jgi:lauroyl/myristoyl acyltransferase
LFQRLASRRYRRYYEGTRPQAANIRERLNVTRDAAEAILLRSYELELLAIADGTRSDRLTGAGAERLIEVSGGEHLAAALAGGRGAVVTAGHCEGLLVVLACLGVLGQPLNVVRLRAGHVKGRLARWAYDRRNRRLEEQGCRFLWMEPGEKGFGVGVRALNALRRNEIVLSPVDLTQSGDNAVVEFLGGRALFPRGLPLLARTAGAPLLDLFVYRGGAGRLVAEIGPALEVSDVDAGVQHAASRLEQQVRLHPADWSPWHSFDAWRGLET